jgi:hypothetical protein
VCRIEELRVEQEWILAFFALMADVTSSGSNHAASAAKIDSINFIERHSFSARQPVRNAAIPSKLSTFFAGWCGDPRKQHLAMRAQAEGAIREPIDRPSQTILNKTKIAE